MIKCVMSDNIALNKQRFLDTVSDKGGKLLSDYVNYSTKVQLECIMGHKWMVTLDH